MKNSIHYLNSRNEHKKTASFSSLFIIINVTFITHVHHHVVFIIITIVKKYLNRIIITECVSGSRFRLAIISPRGLCFIAEFYDTEFCDDIETSTSTAVAAIFRVCFVVASSETYVNQKKKRVKKKNTIFLVAVSPFLFFIAGKLCEKM